jgi:nascent polypeptide-associated complex subunit alpha
MRVDPRQMANMMRRMGIQSDDIEGVEEVVIRAAHATYRFARPQVSRVRAQGSETWQVQGIPREEPRGPAAAAPNVAPVGPAPTLQGPVPSNLPPVGSEARYTPDADDVRMVMQRTGASEAAARKALAEAGGNLAEALVKLGA